MSMTEYGWTMWAVQIPGGTVIYFACILALTRFGRSRGPAEWGIPLSALLYATLYSVVLIGWSLICLRLFP